MGVMDMMGQGLGGGNRLYSQLIQSLPLGGKDPWAAFDFINNSAIYAGSFRGALSNTPNWTFTRASTAYYRNSAGVLIPFGSGVLRTGDRGALIEGARTNLCLQSQDFATTWARAGVDSFGSGSTINATAAPDGTATADFLRPSTASASHGVAQAVTHTAASYTFSIYLKPAGYTKFGIRENTTLGSHSTYDLTGAGVLIDNPSTATITALADGWYRVTKTFTGAAVAQTMGLYILDDGYTTGSPHSYAYTGDGVKGMYFWGAQDELGAFPSSYIPTTTASATRAADSLTVTGVTGLDYPLTLFAEFERAVDTGAPEGLIQVDTATNDRAVLTVSSGDLGQLYVQDGGVDQVIALAAGAMAVGTVYKAAARISLNDSIVARGGTLSAQDTSCTMPDAPTSIRLGNQNGVSSPLFGYLRRAAIFASAKTDAQLQAMTA